MMAIGPINTGIAPTVQVGEPGYFTVSSTTGYNMVSNLPAPKVVFGKGVRLEDAFLMFNNNIIGANVQAGMAMELMGPVGVKEVIEYGTPQHYVFQAVEYKPRR